MQEKLSFPPCNAMSVLLISFCEQWTVLFYGV